MSPSTDAGMSLGTVPSAAPEADVTRQTFDNHVTLMTAKGRAGLASALKSFDALASGGADDKHLRLFVEFPTSTDEHGEDKPAHPVPCFETDPKTGDHLMSDEFKAAAKGFNWEVLAVMAEGMEVAFRKAGKARSN